MSNITERAHGLDISKYDLFFRPEEATGQLDFVVQRISYRTTRDEAFDTLIGGVLSVPIRGGYHYLNSDTDWKRQADKFIEYTSPHKYHFFGCDFEKAFNILSVDFAYRAWQWIDYVQNKTGILTSLYTNPASYKDFIVPSQNKFGINWNSVPLWQAQWLNTPNPNGIPSLIPNRTSGWKLWQYTAKGNGKLYGVARPTACDLDVFNGTVNDMRTWLGLDVEPPTITPKHKIVIYSDGSVKVDDVFFP